jgi:hypothetical protein
MERKLYQHIASMCEARKNCIKSENKIWEERHTDNLITLQNFLPSGSGIDSGCKIDMPNSGDKAIRITSSFHNMDEHGMYDGWIDFRVVVTPSLSNDFNIDIYGQFGKHQDLKEYLADTFRWYLCKVINHKYEDGETKFVEIV